VPNSSENFNELKFIKTNNQSHAVVHSILRLAYCWFVLMLIARCTPIVLGHSGYFHGSLALFDSTPTRTTDY